MIAPTILIGVGGIGSEICCRVSKLVRDESQRRRLRFVCIDTDINDLRQRKAEDSRIITIQTSAPYTIGNYLKINTHAREEWFPIHNILNGKTPTEGAGQVRAISRIAFDTAVREGAMEALEKAIEELYYLNGVSDPQAIRVMIISTLAGGTGSGIVLPVALYVRQFLTNRFHKNASVVRGFFMLPEIMFGNKSPEERGSLCCNAYASIRELDAFTRKSDGVLAEKYSDLQMMMPDATTGDYVDYKVSPFNFCFLYDKRNTDDQQLMSFNDYKEHAANTIYTQTISGISSRSNSNEDNTIKALVSSQGRNRFCGAGSSMMVYPRDSVLEYVASHWAEESMGTEWLRVDKTFQEELKTNKALRKKNPSLKPITKEDYYIEQIENAEKGSFEAYIKEMCFDTIEDEDGTLTEIKKVDKYLVELNKYIDAQIQKDIELAADKAELEPKLNQLELSINGSEDLDDSEEGAIKRGEYESKFTEADQTCERYAKSAKRAAERVGRTLSYQLFQVKDDFTEVTDMPYRLESFLRDEDKRFIHPNAVRYYIYTLHKMLSDSVYEINRDGGTLDSSYKAAMEPFDNPKTENKVEGIAELLARYKVDSVLRKSDRNKVFRAIQDRYESVEIYARTVAQKEIFDAAVLFFKNLIDAFETFYNNFGFYLSENKRKVDDIERRYVNGEGRATRYVCASQTCLQKMLEEMICSGTDVNGTLSATIFQEIKEYSMLVKRPNASVYFMNLFNDKIMGFWRKNVEDEYGMQINKDIIDALMAEAEYESEDGLTDEQTERYAADILEQAEKLAAPFIEEPMGEIRHPFRICAYSPEILGTAGSTRRTFVNKYLNDALSGQPDENVSKYELLVYRAVYNLNAGELKRFQGPEEGEKQGGVYYQAYLDTINQLGPDLSKNKVITPHLDRRWHLPKYMPDLSDHNQEILENRIYTAFVWGMLTGKIKQNHYPNKCDGRMETSYVPLTRGGADTFIVSNKTSCNELYEVLDALEINPPQVTLLLEDMDLTLKRERNSRVNMLEAKLFNCINWDDKNRALGSGMEVDPLRIAPHDPFLLKQYAEEQKQSIFDLLYWLKNSTPADDYDDETMFSILGCMMALLENYVRKFIEKAQDANERCFEIFRDQFTLFMNNLKDNSITRPKNTERINDPLIEKLAIAMDDRIRENYELAPRFDNTMIDIYKKALSELGKEHPMDAVSVDTVSEKS